MGMLALAGQRNYLLSTEQTRIFLSQRYFFEAGGDHREQAALLIRDHDHPVKGNREHLTRGHQ